jgi:hypothetical protein
MNSYSAIASKELWLCEAMLGKELIRVFELIRVLWAHSGALGSFGRLGLFGRLGIV